MQNDVLKNNIVPWQEKGRWYHLKLESDGTAWSIINSESDPIFNGAIIISSVYVYLSRQNDLFNVIDAMAIINDIPQSGQSITYLGGTTWCINRTSTRIYYVLPSANTYTGSVDLWIFAF